MTAPADLDVRAIAAWALSSEESARSRLQDGLTAPHTAAASIALEHAVMPMNLEMDQSLTNVGVPHTYELHPGLHSGPYWEPYVRSQLEAHLAALVQAKRVTIFDYRSIDTDFEVWDWQFSVRPEGVAFLNVRDVSCDGFALQGSGVVTVRVPGRCCDAAVAAPFTCGTY